MDDHERDKFVKAFTEKPDALIDFVATGAESMRVNLDAERAKTLVWLDEQKDIGKMRRYWSGWLLASIVAIVFFDFIFVILLGVGILSFQNQNTVFAFIVENLVKIAGLALIVVKFLFQRNNGNPS